MEISEDDTSSETSDTPLHINHIEHTPASQTLIEDLTEEDKFLSDTSSLSSLVLKDGPPEIKPRPYQLEMLEESLKRNIIVAVCYLSLTKKVLKWANNS